MYAAEDALGADAVVLANRVKLHTDFNGRIESGLSKMAVIGVGKQRGADEAHRAALATGFDEVIPERAAILFEETPIVGGVAVIENAEERAAHVEAGIDRTSTYMNPLTGGQPERGRLSVILPSDEHALRATFSTVGVRDPADLRIARIPNTLEPDDLVVSEPVARELAERDDVTVGGLRTLRFEDGALSDPTYGVTGL